MCIYVFTLAALNLSSLYIHTIHIHYTRYIGCRYNPSNHRRQAGCRDSRHRAALSLAEPGCSGGHSGGRGGRQLIDSGSGGTGGGRITHSMIC